MTDIGAQVNQERNSNRYDKADNGSRMGEILQKSSNESFHFININNEETFICLFLMMMGDFFDRKMFFYIDFK